jgi:predicted small lipoprotein YifL
MIKKISFIILICCLLASCGKKGDPEYKDPKQKVEKIVILKNKA